MDPSAVRWDPWAADGGLSAFAGDYRAVERGLPVDVRGGGVPNGRRGRRRSRKSSPDKRRGRAAHQETPMQPRRERWRPPLPAGGLLGGWERGIEGGEGYARALASAAVRSARSAAPVAAVWMKVPQVQLFWPSTCASARRMAMLAAASTIHSKFSSPIEWRSASGAGLQKSI